MKRRGVNTSVFEDNIGMYFLFGRKLLDPGNEAIGKHVFRIINRYDGLYIQPYKETKLFLLLNGEIEYEEPLENGVATKFELDNIIRIPRAGQSSIYFFIEERHIKVCGEYDTYFYTYIFMKDEKL